MRNFLTSLFTPELRTKKIDTDPPGSADITLGTSFNVAGNTMYGFPTPVNADWAATKGYVDSKVGPGVPTGCMMMWPVATAPTDWLLCNGALVSTTTYATLFALVAHTFNGGVDPGGGQFRLPDLIRRVPVGAGGGIVVGRSDPITNANAATRSFSHNHGIGVHTHGLGTANEQGVPTGTGGGQRLTGGNTSGPTANPTANSVFDDIPSLCLNFIIKFT